MSSQSFARALGSKWTAVQPQNGEKHFLVTRIADHKTRMVKLECVVTCSTQIIAYEQLTGGGQFVPGWH